MSFEAEVIPLFIGGVIAVSAIEFFLGWRSLRHRKDLRGLFAGHVVAMLLGFFFSFAVCLPTGWGSLWVLPPFPTL